MNRKERARQRWQILKEALSGSRSTETSKYSISVRRFSGYGLLTTDVLESEGSKGATWYRYACPYQKELQMDIRHLPGTINAETLNGFNNTGNVCVWPAEEVMSYYCLKNIQQFKDSSICELGGGMTCLAGIAMCMLSDASHILVTDGNEDSVLNLKKIIQHKDNQINFKVQNIDSSVLRWGCGDLDKELTNKFDFIICADCLFFEEGREDLIQTVYNLLKNEGIALMFAPKRGKTFDEFVTLAKSTFNTEILEKYDDVVWDLHCKLKTDNSGQYDENIHYPCLFFEEGREDLIQTVYNLLKNEGIALMFALKRGKTFDEFVTLAKSTFNTEILEKYDDVVWDLHCKLKTDNSGQYDENIHYPWFMKLTKK